MKRRIFIQTSLAAGASIPVPGLAKQLIAETASLSASQSPSDDSRILPWQREVPLREAAKSVVLQKRLDPKDPLPDSGEYFGGPSMSINNLKMRTTIWGQPDRITISLDKNNVWDRRLNLRSLQAPTLKEIIVHSPLSAPIWTIARVAEFLYR